MSWMLKYAEERTATRVTQEAIRAHLTAVIRGEDTEHGSAFEAGKAALVKEMGDSE